MSSIKQENNEEKIIDLLIEVVGELTLHVEQCDNKKTKIYESPSRSFSRPPEEKTECYCGRCYNNFCGAGVIPVDLDKGEIILVKDWRKRFGDAGGKCESSHKSLSDTAACECYEEFRTLIDIRNQHDNLTKLPSVDLKKHHKYRTYFLPVNGEKQVSIDCSEYHTQDTLDKIENLGPAYKETTDIATFSIALIKEAWLANKNLIPKRLIDVNGVSQKVHHRFQLTIGIAFYKGIF
jgi:hypothetical protein